MTHPSLEHRARAIGEIGNLAGERITNAVAEAATGEVIPH
jgi:hypothetical protein